MKRWRLAVAAVSSVVIGTLSVSTPSGAAEAPQAPPQPASSDDRRGGAGPTSVRAQLGLSAAESLVLKDVIRDADGTVHRRYDRTFKGLPVMGGDLIVHRSARGQLTVDWASDADLSGVPTTEPLVTAAAATGLAARTTDLRSSVSDAELVVYAIGDEASLAWRATATGDDARELVFVDALSGDRIAGWSDIHDADGTGKTLYSGQVRFNTVKVSSAKYELRDTARGNHRIFDAQNGTGDPPTGALMTDRDNVWGNFSASNRQSAAADVAYGHKVTWDFYKNTFGRNGIRNNGTTPRSYVHQGTNYENAYYDDVCYCMVYGDGGSTFRPLVSLDVVSHEMSHGTTAATADLIYFGESGGLNEATSDIFGTMAEFYAGNGNDKGDYYIGEKIVKVAPGFLRRMDKPSLDGVSYNCWSSTMGSDDVHYTSGPANHFFYLLAEGSGAKVIGGRNHNSPTCNGANVAGIGRLAAGKIWYRALNVYMTSTANYLVARDATIRAARDLYGANSNQCKRVVQAWNAVKAPSGDWKCSGTPAPRGANVVLNPGFEAGSNGQWSDPNGVITNSAFAWPRSGSRYAYLNGVGSDATHTLAQTITVPNSASAKLRFWRLIYTEDSPFDAYDTLKVQVSHSGGTTTLKTLSNQDANNTYTRDTLSLSAYAGQSVTLRFVGTEDFLLATHFLIDDVSVTPN